MEFRAQDGGKVGIDLIAAKTLEFFKYENNLSEKRTIKCMLNMIGTSLTRKMAMKLTSSDSS